MYATEQLEQLEELADLAPIPVVDEGSSTQQLLDELLGRFEDDDSRTAHTLTFDSYVDSAE